MTIHHRLVSFHGGIDLVLLVHTRGDVASGKFLLGRHLVVTNLMALVFDDGPAFHSGIVQKYHIHPLGGGMFDIDSSAQTISLYGASKAYGREPNRETTRRALLTIFPDWQITAT